MQETNLILSAIAFVTFLDLVYGGDMGDYGIAVLSFFSSSIGNFDFDVQYCPII